ncbi:MAG: two-component sensor histidine kinase [Pseudopedobacter saltans]|uniref:histidine kinase n=1 Tax=Pseudopedobacter saltans TaxID=151895 RepID=A0A2W5GVS1_9SPHI|nr:MAG: two-component sensor histidine kinase [Pseudopedobacter saltans]
MSKKYKKHQLKLLTVSFAFLLLYIIAGFTSWFFALESQNRQMYHFRLIELKQDDPEYLEKIDALKDAKKRKTFQYVGEGSTYLLVILIGAAYVFWTTRQQLLLSRKQQNFMMAVTHELKTPIAITKLNLETVLKRNLDDLKRNKLLDQSLEETKRLDALVNNILTASQLESNEYILNISHIDWSERIENALYHFQNRYPTRQITTQIEPNVFIDGEVALLDLVLNNFLDNARKYSDKDSTISVELKKTSQWARLSFMDEGIGIKQEERERIFEKFYRVGNEETRKTKGTGLGLFLCQKIVTDHNGSILIADNQPKGTIFTIQLPLSKEQHGK